MTGFGTEIDYKEAVKWFRTVADNNRIIYEDLCTEAMSRLSDCYLHGKGVEKDLIAGAKWRLKAWAKKPPSVGAIVLGLLLGWLFQTVTDLCRLCKLRKKANSGDIDAMMKVATHYLSKKDISEASKWWRKAAEQGLEPAKQLLDEISK